MVETAVHAFDLPTCLPPHTPHAHHLCPTALLQGQAFAATKTLLPSSLPSPCRHFALCFLLHCPFWHTATWLHVPVCLYALHACLTEDRQATSQALGKCPAAAIFSFYFCPMGGDACLFTLLFRRRGRRDWTGFLDCATLFLCLHTPLYCYHPTLYAFCFWLAACCANMLCLSLSLPNPISLLPYTFP